MEVEGLITCNLTDEQWITASDICVLLEPFMVAQKVLEGQKHVTISLVPYIIVQIREGLNTLEINSLIYYLLGRLKKLKTAISIKLSLLQQR